MAIVYLGLGSNIGDRRGNLEKAIAFLEMGGIIVKKKSSLYETEPWGEPAQPAFLNMAVEIETEFDPWALLTVLKDIEARMGRKKAPRWGPRIIDLDILLYNHIILENDILVIPHPFMHEREFVLRPLREIAGDVLHPRSQMRICDLFERVTSRSTKNNGIS